MLYIMDEYIKIKPMVCHLASLRRFPKYMISFTYPLLSG